ncbi:hypothetical protein GQ54DRAFT_58908 [Martensiomyces pterosporus]|nr:hypothetical protein GQ54DRAFT_58908 [Martensiomyces pterosporus]
MSCSPTIAASKTSVPQPCCYYLGMMHVQVYVPSAGDPTLAKKPCTASRGTPADKQVKEQVVKPLNRAPGTMSPCMRATIAKSPLTELLGTRLRYYSVLVSGTSYSQNAAASLISALAHLALPFHGEWAAKNDIVFETRRKIPVTRKKISCGVADAGLRLLCPSRCCRQRTPSHSRLMCSS